MGKERVQKGISTLTVIFIRRTFAYYLTKENNFENLTAWLKIIVLLIERKEINM